MFKFLKKVFGKKKPGIVLSYGDLEKLIYGLNDVASKLEVLYQIHSVSDLEVEDIFKSVKKIQDYTTMSADDIGKEGEIEKYIRNYKKVVVLDDIDYSPCLYHPNASKKLKRVYSEEKREDIYWVHINYFVDLGEEYEELNTCFERGYGLLPDFTIKLNDAVKHFRIISSLPSSCCEIDCSNDNIKKIYDKLSIGNEMLKECLEWNKSNNCKLDITLIRRGGAFAAQMGN